MNNMNVCVEWTPTLDLDSTGIHKLRFVVIDKTFLFDKFPEISMNFLFHLREDKKFLFLLECCELSFESCRWSR